jgi:hypothetical protein
MGRGWKERLVPVVSALQPAARVAERIAAVAVHIKTPSLTGIAGVAGTALSALSDQLGNSKAPMWSLDMLVSRGQLIQAFREAGARVVVTRNTDGSEYVECRAAGMVFWIHAGGSVGICSESVELFVEWLRQALDRVLPPAIGVRRKIASDRETYESRPLTLSTYENKQADEILAATLPLVDDAGRCILLDGRPGVGKTTMAQIIARKARLGRVVLLDAGVVGAPHDETGAVSFGHPPSSGDMRDAIKTLSAGVVIVDDIDKVRISLAKLEALRSASRLVILTANNGQYDEVLDAALMRAGRVDEVFTIEPSPLGRDAPFDALTDAQWTEVCQWPVAYLNEVKKRLHGRPGALRLDDLRTRLARKTRSGDVLK